MERKRIIVAFGDIRGFRKWILRAMNAPEIAGTFMDSVYVKFEEYARQSNAYMKFMGDGFMVVRELREGHNCGVAREFLHALRNLSTEIADLMKGIYPRPDGFRVRVTCGHVWKRHTLKQMHGRFVKHPEYIGYAINMAQSLLYTYPEIECICHEGIVELIGTKKNGLIMQHLEPPTERRHGVDPQDFAGLWSFGIDGKDKKSV